MDTLDGAGILPELPAWDGQLGTFSAFDRGVMSLAARHQANQWTDDATPVGRLLGHLRHADKRFLSRPGWRRRGRPAP